MAASNKTAKLQLNQWVGTDPFRMADFNEDNAKIDAAFGAMPRVAAGTYTGDGAAEQMIALDFTPMAVLVFTVAGRTSIYASKNYYYGGLALQGTPCYYADPSRTIVSVETGGFKVYCNSTYNIMANENGATMHYLAIG